MKVLYLNAGNETGGGMHHILYLLKKMKQNDTATFMLGVMEKKELYERATSLGIDTVHFESDTRFSFSLLQKLAHFINEHEITHVHSHGPRANVYMNLLRKKHQANWIVTVHSDPYVDFKEKGIRGKLLTLLHVNAIKNADKVISVSETFHPPLLDAGLGKNQLTTIHNGIDFSTEISEEWTFQSPREEFGFNQDDFLFVKVARLEAVKGHHIAIKALATCIERHRRDNIHLLLVGDGTLKEALQSYARQLNVEKNVHFLGERKDVFTFYEMADVTLLTSLSESFPYVLLESARAKKPVITANVGDINHLVKKDLSGWKVKAGDVAGFAFAMEEAVWYRERGMLRNIGDNLFIHASDNFSLDKCVDEVYNVYRTM